MALYTPIAKEEYDDDQELLQSPEASDGYVREARWKTASTKPGFLSRALPIFSILVSITSLIVALTRTNLIPLPIVNSSTTNELKMPEQRSSYVGIERVMKLKTWRADYPDIRSVPLTVAQISKTRPNDVMPDDRPHVWTNFGTAFPEARHVIVNTSISTVLQLRTLDYGMEDCRLTVNLRPNTVLDKDISAPLESSAMLNVWLLDSSKRVDLMRMTYRSRPQRMRLLGSFDLAQGGNGTTDGYGCTSNMPYYVELECIGEGCELDFWQVRASDVPSISLLQKSTIDTVVSARH